MKEGIQEAKEHIIKIVWGLFMLLAVNNKCQEIFKEVLFKVFALKELTIQVERKCIQEVQF